MMIVASPWSQAQTTTRVSVASDGTEANEHSTVCAISGNGRFVVFTTSSDNLVPNDNNGASDVFVRDMWKGETKCVSVTPTGVTGNGESPVRGATISDNGRYIAFDSMASNLVQNDSNPYPDVFVRDMETGTTALVSVSLAGSGANWGSLAPTISADGRYIAFDSGAGNIVPGDRDYWLGDGAWDIFIRDISTNSTRRVSALSDGTGGNGDSYSPTISADGSVVAFQTYASNLAGTGGGILIKDLGTNSFTFVGAIRRRNGTEDRAPAPSVSAKGNFVAYETLKSYPEQWESIVWERATRASHSVQYTRLGDVTNPHLSADGRYVVFTSNAPDIGPREKSVGYNTFVQDLRTGAFIYVSAGLPGTDDDGFHNGSSAGPISKDGKYISFTSGAKNLVPSDGNNVDDVFIWGPLEGIAPPIVPEATLVASPSTLPADGGSASRLTLTYGLSNGESVAGHEIRFSSSRTQDVFHPSRIVTDQNGIASVTVSSSSPGTSVISVQDITTRDSIRAWAEVEFLDISSDLWLDVQFQDEVYGKKDVRGDKLWRTVSRTVDGNVVRVTATITNRTSYTQLVDLRLFDGGSTSSSPLLISQPISGHNPVTVPANGHASVTWEWDTQGYAWDSNFSPHPRREVTARMFRDGIQSGQPKSASIIVIPKPLILVHGLWSSADTWKSYNGFVSQAHPYWSAWAVGSPSDWGTMNTGSTVLPDGATYSVEQNARIMGRYIESVRKGLNAQHVDVVAHSMGGLISRKYIQDYMPEPGDGRPVVAHLFTLGTPHLGARLSDLAGGGRYWQPAMTELSPEYIVNTFNKYVGNLRNVSLWTFRGELDYLVGDGIVSLDSAWWKEDNGYKAPPSHRSEAVVSHMKMTSDQDIFQSFILPALAVGPGQVVSAPPPGVFMAGAGASEGTDTSQIILSDKVSLPAGHTTSKAITIPECTKAKITIIADDFISSKIKDPTGTVVAAAAAYSDEAKRIVRVVAIDQPTQGTWTVEFERSGQFEVSAVVSVAVNDTNTGLDLTRLTVGDDRRVTMMAEYVSGAVPIGGADLTASLVGIRGGTASLILRDDGAHGDGAANDGVYGGTTEPMRPDQYRVVVTAVSDAGNRLAGGLVSVPAPMYSISDVVNVLRYAGGLSTSTITDLGFLDVEILDTPNSLTLEDASTMLRGILTKPIQSNGSSRSPALSADGQYLAFTSDADNLVAGDSNQVADVFIRNLKTGHVVRVSVSTDGVEANKRSGEPSISADGRFVAFSSYASNLVPDDTNNRQDVFVRDTVQGTTRRVSLTSNGTEVLGDSLRAPNKTRTPGVIFCSDSSK